MGKAPIASRLGPRSAPPAAAAPSGEAGRSKGSIASRLGRPGVFPRDAAPRASVASRLGHRPERASDPYHAPQRSPQPPPQQRPRPNNAPLSAPPARSHPPRTHQPQTSEPPPRPTPTTTPAPAPAPIPTRPTTGITFINLAEVHSGASAAPLTSRYSRIHAQTLLGVVSDANTAAHQPEFMMADGVDISALQSGTIKSKGRGVISFQ
ncbi:hypothetical protein HDU98_002586 [Podochytrium sp. JEL0797]|nr:hypothetical protein HDU98_002586 [Podochytrium sp. JEL0797]